MKVLVSIKQLNSGYDQKYADEYHGGEESENNLKTHWENSVEVIGNVKEIVLKDDTTYSLKGLIDGKEFSYDIPDMQVLDCITDSGDKSVFAISNKLISKTHQAQNKKYKRTHYYFYLKDGEEFIRASSNIVIAKSNFPPDLLQ